MKNKILFIGIDAMDPRIVDALDLPNLKGLKTYKRLETTIPPETPVAWSAASTGTNPGKFGIFDFISRDPKTYLPKLNLSHEKRGMVKTSYVTANRGVPFWKILSDNGIKSTIIRWPVTFPADRIKGRILSGLGVVDLKGMLGKYSFYTNEDINPDKEGSEKRIKVDFNADSAETFVSGPLINKGGKMKDVKAKLGIKINGDAINILINGRDYQLKEGQWSGFIRTEFKVYFLKVYGIFRLYLESINPFRMYMTSVQIDPENQNNLNITHPEDYGKELVENIGMFHTLGIPEDTKAVTEGAMKKDVFISQTNQIEEERTKMFEYEFKRFDQGLLALVFDSGDRIKHLFWNKRLCGKGFNEKDIPEEIKDYYKKKDKLIGEIISRIDDYTKLIIMSDHGFNNFDRKVNINNWLVENGYMKANGKGLLFESVDWEHTKAYSLGFTSIYLNIKNREGKGIVDSEEKKLLIKEIIEKLKELKDGDKPVFTNIYEGDEIYEGDFSSDAPDIVLGFSPGYRMSWKSVSGGLDDNIISDNDEEWLGDHLIDRTHVPGVLFTNFEINKESPSIIDIAPTILKLFDIGIPGNIDGKSLIM